MQGRHAELGFQQQPCSEPTVLCCMPCRLTCCTRCRGCTTCGDTSGAHNRGQDSWQRGSSGRDDAHTSLTAMAPDPQCLHYHRVQAASRGRCAQRRGARAHHAEPQRLAQRQVLPQHNGAHGRLRAACAPALCMCRRRDTAQDQRPSHNYSAARQHEHEKIEERSQERRTCCRASLARAWWLCVVQYLSATPHRYPLGKPIPCRGRK